MPGAAQQLAALLVENGREHLKVRTEQGALIVHSVSDEGIPQTHLRLSPAGRGYAVWFFEEGTWRPSEICGSLTEVVEALVASGASRRQPATDEG